MPLVETAERVRTLELTRLDSLQSEIWANCVEGDLAAINTFLRVQDQRCRLLGLYPKDGAMVQVGIANKDAEDIEIRFVYPSAKPEPVDLTPLPNAYANVQPDLSRPQIEKPRPCVDRTTNHLDRRPHLLLRRQSAPGQNSLL